MGLGVIAALAVIYVLNRLATNALKEAGIDDDESADPDDNDNAKKK